MPIPFHAQPDVSPYLLVALAFWLIAILVRIKKHADPIACRVFWFNVACAAVLTARTPVVSSLPWAMYLEILSLGALPFLFLWASSWIAYGRAPDDVVGLVLRVLGIAGTIAVTVSLIAAYTEARFLRWLVVVLLALAVAGLASGVLVLVRECGKPRSSHARGQVEVVLLGIAVAACPLAILVLFPKIVGSAPLASPETAVLFSVFLPGAFAYSTLRRDVLGISIVVSRSLVHRIVVVLLAGFYALLLYAVVKSGIERWHYSALPWVLFFAILVLTFPRTEYAIRKVIDTVFYRDHYDYADTLRQLGERLTSMEPLQDVLPGIAKTLREAMNLTGAAILVRQPDGTFVVSGRSGGYREEWAPEMRPDLIRGECGEKQQSDEGGWYIPFTTQGELRGLFYLGPKQAPAGFTASDLSLVQTLSTQAATAVANAALIETLRHKLDDMELLQSRLMRVQDEERRRLAENLHDGALRTALELERQADTSALPSRLDADSVSRLNLVAERSRDISYQLRELSAHLYPSELSHLGLVAALEHLAARTSFHEDVSVSVSRSGIPEDVSLPSWVEETLYRVSREALENVIRHAGACRATIHLVSKGPEMRIVIQDDGKGFTVPPPSALLQRGHLGLVSMRERIEHLGGSYSIESVPSRGTTVTFSITIADSCVTHQTSSLVTE